MLSLISVFFAGAVSSPWADSVPAVALGVGPGFPNTAAVLTLPNLNQIPAAKFADLRPYLDVAGGGGNGILEVQVGAAAGAGNLAGPGTSQNTGLVLADLEVLLTGGGAINGRTETQALTGLVAADRPFALTLAGQLEQLAPKVSDLRDDLRKAVLSIVGVKFTDKIVNALKAMGSNFPEYARLLKVVSKIKDGTLGSPAASAALDFSKIKDDAARIALEQLYETDSKLALTLFSQLEKASAAAPVAGAPAAPVAKSKLWAELAKDTAFVQKLKDSDNAEENLLADSFSKLKTGFAAAEPTDVEVNALVRDDKLDYYKIIAAYRTYKAAAAAQQATTQATNPTQPNVQTPPATGVKTKRQTKGGSFKFGKKPKIK